MERQSQRHVATSELLVGVEGLALLRHLYDGDDEDAAPRLREVRAILDGAAVEHAAEPIAEADPGEGDLLAIPFADDGFDVVVCGLALAHVARLGVAVAELARVLAPGGRAVISVLHPLLTALGWHAPNQDAEGRRGFVREHDHTHSDYLAALRSAGLRLEALAERRFESGHVAAQRRAMREIPEATVAAYAGLPGVLALAASKP